ncbi:MAG TPA: RICIN domain-containing protein, partial [Chthoniobacterales bacterium]
MAADAQCLSGLFISRGSGRCFAGTAPPAVFTGPPPNASDLPQADAGRYDFFRCRPAFSARGRFFLCIVAGLGCFTASLSPAQIAVTVDPTAKQQTIDGFGTCLSGIEAQSSWWQQLYFDDLGASMLRVDLSPPLVSPYSDQGVYSPSYGNPGPDGNYVRTYTGPTDYGRLYNGWTAPVAVMGPDINQNVKFFDFAAVGPKTAGLAAQAGVARRSQLGDFKLFGSLWSPAPWLKVSSGNAIGSTFANGPKAGTAWPFIWLGNYAGGKLDVSNVPLPVFNDGTGPTSTLTQFARSIAAFVRGFQNTYGVPFYAISIQNELNFEEFYNSCTYPLSAQYIAALKVVRAELDKYPDLKNVKIEGPEDLLGGDAYGMWQYGGGSSEVDKNLHYLHDVAADPAALAALAFCSIHGYANNGVSAAGADPTQWNWWSNGWSASPAPGIPAGVLGFAGLGRKSWMTETSGEDPGWLSPASGYPNNGAWSIALKIQEALTNGQESGWVYWQFTDGNPVGASTLTDATATNTSAKFIAAKHFFRFIRPNSYRVTAAVTGSTQLTASAFVNDANQSLTVVLVNSGSTPVTLALNLGGTGITTLQTYTSSNVQHFQASTTAVSAGTGSVTLPAYGVTTLFGTGSGGNGIISGAVYQLGSKVSGGTKLMDVSGQKTANGSAVIAWLNNHGSNQRWRVQLQPAGTYTLTPQNAVSKLLEVAQAGTADGTPVDIWADHLGGNQRWIIARTADGYWTLSPGFETG